MGRRLRLLSLLLVVLALAATSRLPAEPPEAAEPDSSAPATKARPAPSAPPCAPVEYDPLIRRKSFVMKDGHYGEGTYERYGAAAIVRLHGRPYEMGYQHGAMLRQEIQRALDRQKQRRPRGAAPLERTYWLTRYYLSWPEWVREELAGMARGAGVLTPDLVWLNVIYARMAGTSQQAPARREVFDPDLLDDPRWIVAIHHPEGAPKYATVTRPGGVGALAGLRESGCCLTAWTVLDERRAGFQLDEVGPKSRSQVRARVKLSQGLCGESVRTAAARCELTSFELGEDLTLTIDAPQGLICISEPGRPAAAVDVIRETFSDDCSACEVVPEGG